jgi:hypothetical protein
MTAKKAMIVGVLGAGLVTLGLMMAPAHAEQVFGPFTDYTDLEIKDLEGFANSKCEARGEFYLSHSYQKQGDGYLVTYTCAK